uniref:Uncharacterized protein n=1 Tax=Anopheles culicifacies TaxID=139723 RepID=A0A182M6N7_9DIPT
MLTAHYSSYSENDLISGFLPTLPDVRRSRIVHSMPYQSKHHHERHWGPFFEEPVNVTSGAALQVGYHLSTEAILNCRVGMLKDKTVSIIAIVPATSLIIHPTSRCRLTDDPSQQKKGRAYILPYEIVAIFCFSAPDLFCLPWPSPVWDPMVGFMRKNQFHPEIATDGRPMDWLKLILSARIPLSRSCANRGSDGVFYLFPLFSDKMFRGIPVDPIGDVDPENYR